jgi:hypothetical protein
VTNQAVGGICTTQYTVTSGEDTGDVIDALALVSENGQYFEYGKNTTNGCAAIGFGNVLPAGPPSAVTATMSWSNIRGYLV